MTRDYNVCPDTEDGKHVPEDHYDPEAGDGFATVQCKNCGLTTGIRIPDDIEWN